MIRKRAISTECVYYKGTKENGWKSQKVGGISISILIILTINVSFNNLFHKIIITFTYFLDKNENLCNLENGGRITFKMPYYCVSS